MVFKIIFVFSLFSISKSWSQSYDPLICEKWNKLDKQIINQTIDKEDALLLLENFEPTIQSYFHFNKGAPVKRSDWIFPLKNLSSIHYRDYGNDYRVSGYDYFQGSNTKGHPAHDLMIFDKNKDLIEDSTGKIVDVVSMSSGVVVATDTTWKIGSLLRGGKYIKIFDVTNDGIFYYSHLSKVTVTPGQIINAGDKIGEVGRTGRKAILPEGKTHLHIAFLKSKSGYPNPEDILFELRESEKKYFSKK